MYYIIHVERGMIMQDFDKISIQEMTKDDMLLIIKALEYTGNETEISDFIDLKNSIVEELSAIAEVSQADFMEYLEK